MAITPDSSKSFQKKSFCVQAFCSLETGKTKKQRGGKTKFLANENHVLSTQDIKLKSHHSCTITTT